MALLIADDHPFTLTGIKSFIAALGYNVAYTCNNGITAYNMICMHLPTIAILDVNMPGMDGLEVLEKVSKDKVPVRIILLTIHNEVSIYNRAVELGVYGYLLKNFATDDMKICLQQVSRNVKYISNHLQDELIYNQNNESTTQLTLAEKKVLQLIGEQKTSKQIAELLFIAEKTVEGHRRNIVHKLNLPKEKNILLRYVNSHKNS